MKWTKNEINHIKVSLNHSDAQQLANELGTAKTSVKKKIREIKATKRLSKLSKYISSKKQKV